MKNLVIGLIVSLSLNAMALDVGDVYQNDATDLLHIMADDSEVIADVTAKAPGHNKLVIEFFSTTCYYCNLNRPSFIQLSNEFASTATFKMIGLDRNEQILRSFYTKIKADFDFPFVLDLKRAASRAFKITATPTSFILDENGKVLFRHEGTFDEADKEAIREILK